MLLECERDSDPSVLAAPFVDGADVEGCRTDGCCMGQHVATCATMWQRAFNCHLTPRSNHHRVLGGETTCQAANTVLTAVFSFYRGNAWQQGVMVGGPSFQSSKL